MRRLRHASGTLAGFEDRRDRRIPGRFGDVSLFIDDGDDSQLPEDPGDADALPHIPATDPATVPPDQGDPGSALPTGGA